MIVHWLILPGIVGIVLFLASPVSKYTLEKTEGTMQNGQARETVNIIYTQDTAQRKTQQRKLKR